MPDPNPTRRTVLECLTSVSALTFCSPRLPALGAADRSPSVTQPPADAALGSLFPFIESQSVEGPASLSYLQPRFKDVAGWKHEARGKLLELLHYAPPACDHKAEVVERNDRGDYVQEKVYFNTMPDLRVPAYVLIPKRANLPAPAVVALHDHGGFYLYGKEKLVENDRENAALTKFKQTYYAGNSIAADLARQGYVVIVIDMFYWGERRLLKSDDPPDWSDRPHDVSPERVAAYNQRSSQNEDLVGRTILSAGFTWSGVMYWDDVRTVDYLVTRPEVDKNRIGCVGLSVGGLRSCHLAALDERIKAAVIVGWMASFPAQLKRHVFNSIGHTKLVPGLYRYLDYPDVATLAMPAALLVINGSRDVLFATGGVETSFKILNDAYRKADVGEKVRTSLHDTPHEFNADMQREAWAWLKKWV